MLPADILDGFSALPDLTGIASDAMDELGIVGAVPAAVLRPTDPKARIVGRALTVRNAPADARLPKRSKPAFPASVRSKRIILRKQATSSCCALGLQRGEEALHRRIVPDIARTAH